jgi:hypothetical protein
VLRLQGSGLCDRVSLSAQIDSYLEVDARLENPVPITMCTGLSDNNKRVCLGSHFQWCFGLTRFDARPN